MDRPKVTPAAILIALAALALGVANASRMIAEFDVPWHLAFGRQIAATWSIPKVDDFAYTHTAIRYLPVLADVLLYAVMRTCGPLGLQIANGLLSIAIAGTLAWDVKVRTGRLAPASLAVIAAAMFSMSAWTFVRPSTLGFLFIAATLVAVRIGTRRALVSAALLAFLWANVNGSVTLGLAILGANGALGARERRFFPLACAGLAVALACINPAGPSLFFASSSIAKLDDIVIDWQHTSPSFFFVVAPSTGVFLVAALLLIAVGKNPDGTRRPSLFDAGLIAAALFGCTRYRFVPIAIMVLAPIAASRVAEVVPRRRLSDLALLLGLSLAGPAVAISDQGTLGVGWDPKSFPEPATAFIEAAKPAGHMWNFWPFGGYLIWRLYPEQRVLIDGRIGFVHDRDTAYEVTASASDPAAWSRLERRFDLQWAICPASESQRTCLPLVRSPEWRMVFLDSMSTVYVRATGPNAGLADRGYRVLNHLTAPERILSAALSGDRAVDLAHDAELLREQDPTAARSWFVDACAGLAIGDRARFEAARAKLAALAPGHAALGVLQDAAAAKWR